MLYITHNNILDKDILVHSNMISFPYTCDALCKLKVVATAELDVCIVQKWQKQEALTASGKERSSNIEQ